MGTTSPPSSEPTPSGPPISFPDPDMLPSPIFSNFPCDDINAITYKSEPITIKLFCYDIGGSSETTEEDTKNMTTQSGFIGNGRMIIQGDGNNDSDNISLVLQPLNGFIEFSEPTLTYYPYKDWSGYDEVILKLSDDTQLFITFTNVDFYACKGDRLPKTQYTTANEGPLVYEGVKCVKPIHIPKRRSDDSSENPREECEQVGGQYNEAVDECQMENIIDPFFRKNYLSFNKTKNKKI